MAQRGETTFAEAFAGEGYALAEDLEGSNLDYLIKAGPKDELKVGDWVLMIAEKKTTHAKFLEGVKLVKVHETGDTAHMLIETGKHKKPVAVAHSNIIILNIAFSSIATKTQNERVGRGTDAWRDILHTYMKMMSTVTQPTLGVFAKDTTEDMLTKTVTRSLTVAKGHHVVREGDPNPHSHISHLTITLI